MEVQNRVAANAVASTTVHTYNDALVAGMALMPMATPSDTTNSKSRLPTTCSALCGVEAVAVPTRGDDGEGEGDGSASGAAGAVAPPPSPPPAPVPVPTRLVLPPTISDPISAMAARLLLSRDSGGCNNVAPCIGVGVQGGGKGWVRGASTRWCHVGRGV